MKNKKIKNNREEKQFSGEAKQLSDEEIKTVNGGMKIVVVEEPSWIHTLLKIIFKIRN